MRAGETQCTGSCMCLGDKRNIKMQNKNKDPVGYSFIHFYLIGSECSPHTGI